MSINLRLVLRVRGVLLLVVVRRHCRVVSRRMLHGRWLIKMPFQSPLLEIICALTLCSLRLLSGGVKVLLLLLLRGRHLRLLLLLLLVYWLLRPLPRH